MLGINWVPLAGLGSSGNTLPCHRARFLGYFFPVHENGCCRLLSLGPSPFLGHLSFLCVFLCTEWGRRLRDGGQGGYPAISWTGCSEPIQTNLNPSLLCLNDPTSLWTGLRQGMEGGFSRVFYLSLIKPNKQTSPLPEASGVDGVVGERAYLTVGCPHSWPVPEAQLALPASEEPGCLHHPVLHALCPPGCHVLGLLLD